HTHGDLLYVRTYTDGGRSEGIYLVRMDRRSGHLRRVGSVAAGANPSFLALHPNRRVLYAVNELEQYNGRPTGAVSAFAIAKDTGALTPLNEQPSEGGAPCFVSVDRSGRVVLVANYVGGNVAVLALRANGALDPAAHVVQHTGTGPNAERQEAPHAHCILPARRRLGRRPRVCLPSRLGRQIAAPRRGRRRCHASRRRPAAHRLPPDAAAGVRRQ